MMEVESGNHANVPGVDLFPVSAVKIQVCYWSSSQPPPVWLVGRSKYAIGHSFSDTGMLLAMKQKTQYVCQCPVVAVGSTPRTSLVTADIIEVRHWSQLSKSSNAIG